MRQIKHTLESTPEPKVKLSQHASQLWTALWFFNLVMKAYKVDCKEIMFYLFLCKLLQTTEIYVWIFFFSLVAHKRITSVFLPTVLFNLENSKSSNKLVCQLSQQIYKLSRFQYQSCLQFCLSEKPISLKTWASFQLKSEMALPYLWATVLLL